MKIIRKVAKQTPPPPAAPQQEEGVEEGLESIGSEDGGGAESHVEAAPAGGDPFFGRRGYQHIPRKGGISPHSKNTIMLRDGESAVLRALELEPVALDTHSIKVGPGRQFSKVVCPEILEKYKGQCPVMNDKHRHSPAYSGVLSFVDMRTALWKESGTGEKTYAYDLSDFTYEPPPNDERYQQLGEEMPDIGTWKKFPRAAKIFWMSMDTSRNLEALSLRLKKTCVNCAKAEKKDTIIRVKDGERRCSCGTPKPASILDCYLKVTRTGSDKDTHYSFDVSSHFGFQDAPRDERGQLFKPLVLKDVVPIPSPEEIKRSMYTGPQ